MRPPAHLQTQLREGKVIPFVGAGVSMVVRDQNGKPLFPSWKELLMRAAERMRDENDPLTAAPVVTALLQTAEPDYFAAAKWAQRGLGQNWHRFLNDQLSHSFNDVNPESLSLAKKVWELGSRLVITTNYDKVLHWSCPCPPNDLRTWDIENQAQQAAALTDGVRRHTVWHLHGYIDNASKIILTPDHYSKLYPTAGNIEPEYKAALTTLNTLLINHSLLFIGFSLNDEHLGLQLKGIDSIFDGASGTHYVLIRQKDVPSVRSLGLPVQILPVDDHGLPLLEYLDILSKIAAEGKRNLAQSKPKFHLRIYHGPSEQAFVEQICSHLNSSSLDLFLETYSPMLAETIAKESVGEADGAIVCLSTSAVTDINFSKLINVALQSVADESVNLNHLIAVNAEDSTELADIGHHPTIRLFTEGGYAQLLKAVALAANSEWRHRASRSSNGDRGSLHKDLQVLRFWNRVSSYRPIALIFPDTPPERATRSIELSQKDFMSGITVLTRLQSLLPIDDSVVTSHSTHAQIDDYIKSHCCVYIAGRVCNPKAKELFEKIQHRLIYKFDRVSNTSLGWITSPERRYDSILEQGEIRLDYGIITAAWRLPPNFSPGNFLWAAGSTGFGTQAAAKATITPTTVTGILSKLDPRAGGFQVIVSIVPQDNNIQVLFDTLVSIDLTDI